MRFRLRTLLIAVAAVGALCGVARWWTMPYVMHRELLRGRLTEDMVFRREFPNGFVQTGLVQYYSNGKKAKEIRYGDESFHYLDGYPRYWLDDGTEVSREEFERRIQALMTANR
jgi:hypothetical protein